MEYDDLSEDEIDRLLKAKVAAIPDSGPTIPAVKIGGGKATNTKTPSADDAEEKFRMDEFNSSQRGAMLNSIMGMISGGPPSALLSALRNDETRKDFVESMVDIKKDIDKNANDKWRFSETAAQIGGGMVGGTIGARFAGTKGASVGGALAAEGSRKLAQAGNEFLDWLDEKKGARILPDSAQSMAEEAMTSANMVYADMATGGLMSRVGVGWQKFKEVFKGKYHEIGRLSPTELKNILDKINVRGNPTLYGGPGMKRISVALSKLPTSAKVMQESINNTFEDLSRYSDDLTNSIYEGGVLSKQSAGKRIMNGLDAWSKEVKSNINKIYENIQGIDKSEYIDLPNTRKALESMRSKDLVKSSPSVFPSELKKFYTDIVDEKVVGKRAAIADIEKRTDFIELPPKEVPRKTKVNVIAEEYVDESGEMFGQYLDVDLAKKRGVIERSSGDKMKFSPKKKEITLVDEILESQPPAEVNISEMSAYVPEDPGIITKPGGKLKWKDATNMRSAIGSKLDAPPLLRMGDKPTGQYSNVYAALTEDLDNYALSKGSGTALQVKRARQYVNAFHKRKALVGKLTDSDTAAAAFNSALTGAKDGPERINALRKSIRSIKGDEAGDVLTLADRQKVNGDDIWDEFVAENFWKIGRAPASQQASVEATDFGINTFLKNYSVMKQHKAIDAMFATPKLKKVQPKLEEFVNVLHEVKDLDKIINFSRTAEQSAAMKLVAGGFGAAPGYAAFGVPGLVIGPLATMGGPYAMSRWLTSKAGLKFLTTAVKEANKIPNTMPQHVMRQFGRTIAKGINNLVKEDPSMAEPAEQYLIEMEKLNSYQQ